jgi:type IV secretory pathway VirB9-like protein
MIRIVQLLPLILLFVQNLPAAQPRTLTCNFDGENATQVYKVVTAVGVGTTFRLPEGWKIADFVVTDPKFFHGESNGTIGIVTPLAPNKTTSVSIFTENEKLFVFNVSSERCDSVDQLVIIETSNLQYFSQKGAVEANKLVRDRLQAVETESQASLERKAKELKQKMLFSLNGNYEIKDRNFSITRVVDDGIFTYIQLAKSQDRPVVYMGESEDPKKLEPLKYTDEGDYYTVHKVLPHGDHKRFYLKLGDDVSEVRPR